MPRKSEADAFPSMLAQDLEKLTQSVPGCLIAAFADIGTGVTLVSHAQIDITRETLDQMAAVAAIHLGKANAPLLGTGTCGFAVTADANAMNVFIRSPEDPADALICKAEPSTDLDRLLFEASAILTAVG